MGRVINPESAGKDRQRLLRSLVLAVREMTQQTSISQHTYDLVAFVVLALDEIAATVEASVGPWEKRGYWLKADRFRMEWQWAEEIAQTMRKAIESEDWAQIALQTGRLAEKISSVEVPKRHRLGTPWEGAWEHFRSNGGSNIR